MLLTIGFFSLLYIIEEDGRWIGDIGGKEVIDIERIITDILDGDGMVRYVWGAGPEYRARLPCVVYWWKTKVYRDRRIFYRILN